jgi:hypothetical protein
MRFILLSLLLLTIIPIANAINSCEDGYIVQPGETKDISCHSSPLKVLSSCSAAIFIPSATISEYISFIDNHPDCITFQSAYEYCEYEPSEAGHPGISVALWYETPTWSEVDMDVIERYSGPTVNDNVTFGSGLSKQYGICGNDGILDSIISVENNDHKIFRGTLRYTTGIYREYEVCLRDFYACMDMYGDFGHCEGYKYPECTIGVMTQAPSIIWILLLATIVMV